MLSSGHVIRCSVGTSPGEDAGRYEWPCAIPHTYESRAKASSLIPLAATPFPKAADPHVAHASPIYVQAPRRPGRASRSPGKFAWTESISPTSPHGYWQDEDQRSSGVLPWTLQQLTTKYEHLRTSLFKLQQVRPSGSVPKTCVSVCQSERVRDPEDRSRQIFGLHIARTRQPGRTASCPSSSRGLGMRYLAALTCTGSHYERHECCREIYPEEALAVVSANPWSLDETSQKGKGARQ